MTKDQTGVAVGMAKPSVVVLIARLALVELALLVAFSILKAPQIIFYQQIGSWLQVANLISWLFLAVSTLMKISVITVTVLAWANEFYLIRNTSITHHWGVFKTFEEEFSLRNIEALTMEQSFWQRIFDFGTIRFFSPVLKREYYLTNIARPKEIRDLIDGVVGSKKVTPGRERIIFRR